MSSTRASFWQKDCVCWCFILPNATETLFYGTKSIRIRTGRGRGVGGCRRQQLSNTSSSRSILTSWRERNDEGGRSSSLCAPFQPASTVRGRPKAVILKSHWARGQCWSINESPFFRAYLRGVAVTTTEPPSIEYFSEYPVYVLLNIARRTWGLSCVYSTTCNETARSSRGKGNVNKVLNLSAYSA